MNPVPLRPYRLALFASGSGTNAEEFFKYFANHQDIGVHLLVSNNPGAYVLRRAENHDVPVRVFTREEFHSGRVLRILNEFKITHVVLAGFLWLVPQDILNRFKKKIFNIHPALLPKYGGKGMFGDNVHEAVLGSGDRLSGITIHHVNEKFDDGEIIFQASCAITSDDTPESLAARIHVLEHEHYPRVVEQAILNP